MTSMDWRWHADKKRLLMLLLGLVVGVEFLENGMFVFAASHIVGGIDAAPREFAIIRDHIRIASVESALYDGIGHVKVKNFQERTDASLFKELEKLQDAVPAQS